MLTRSPLRRSPIARKGKLRQIGKRGRAWATARAKVKADYMAAGLPDRCEIGFPGCWGEIHGWAHCVKRRKLSGRASLGSPANILTVAGSCNVCHDRLEAMKPDEMLTAVMEAIARRVGQGGTE